VLRDALSTMLVLIAAAAPCSVAADVPRDLQSISVELPDDSNTQFPAGPGSDVVNNNCLACHSVDEVLNQPNGSKAHWKETVEKMINVYKAPVAATDVDAIADYLTRIKGPK
jgi:cytochrome c5